MKVLICINRTACVLRCATLALVYVPYRTPPLFDCSLDADRPSGRRLNRHRAVQRADSNASH